MDRRTLMQLATQQILAIRRARPPQTFLGLGLSTGHLPPDVLADLSGQPGVVADPYPYGYWMWVPDDPEDSATFEEEPPAPEVLKIQLVARQLGCDMVRFDVDGEFHPDLPVYDDVFGCHQLRPEPPAILDHRLELPGAEL